MAIPNISLERYETVSSYKAKQTKKLAHNQEWEIDFEDDVPVQDALLQKLIGNASQKKAVNINFARTKEAKAYRAGLPIYQHESEIMEAIDNNLINLIYGSTGSGKSTQLP
jgi:ATP-dependent RNA helicase DHX37/DHR1